MMIPNELSAKFNTLEGRKQIIAEYADSDSMFVGENEDGERVYLSVSDTGMGKTAQYIPVLTGAKHLPVWEQSW